MPLVEYGDRFDDIGAAQKLDVAAIGNEVVTEDPSFLSSLGASFRTDNMVGSAATNKTIGLNRYEREDGFNPLEEIKGTAYEPYAEQAAGIFNRRYFEAWKAQVDQEQDDRRTLEAAGVMGMGTSAIAAILDLPTLIPGGALARTAGKVSISRTAGSVAAAGGVGAVVSEVGLQATQQTRTGTESAIAIGSGIVFGGLLGGAAGSVMSRVEQRAAVAAIDKTRAIVREDAPLTPVADEMEEIFATGGGDLSMGAAARQVDTLDDLSVGGGRAAQAVNRGTAQLNPIMRSMNSPSRVQREVMSGIMENPVYLKKNMEGRGEAAVETLQKQWDRGAFGSAMEDYRGIWQEARAAGTDMTKEDFAKAVGRAMRRDDMGENEFVTKAAKTWRTKVFEPLKQEAIETGLLPKDVDTKTAMSYFHRVYRKDKIRAQENDFKAAVRPHIDANVTKGIEIDTRKASRKADNLRRDIEEREMGILRRQENFRQREEGGEINLAEGATESDVLDMIKQLQSGSRPPEPQRLTSFLRSRGLYDPGGDLSAIGIGPKSAPGLVRKARATAQQKGGLGLDDAAHLAWEEGFFPGFPERPTIREFLDALDEDFNGGRRVVREADYEAATALDRLNEVEATLDRMGVDWKGPKFATSEDMRGFSAKVNKALDDLDRQKIADLRAKLRTVEAEHANLKDPFVSDEDRQEYVENILSEIVQKLTGVDAEDLPYGMVSVKQGPLKERTLNVADEVLEPWLEDDIEMVGRRYTRKMSADVEMTRRYGRADLKDQVQEVINDYEAMKVGVTDEKELTRLNKRRDADIRDMKAVRDMLRGNYLPQDQSSNFARVMRGAMAFNYMRSLGGVLLASATDAVRPAMVHGLKSYMQDGIVPLITNLKAVRMSAKDAKLAGAISERILQSRLATLAELTDPYSANSPFERFIDNAANKFSTLTGLNHWNDFQKTLASTMTQNRILKNAERGLGALKAREKAYMGYLGLDEDMAARVAKQFQTHGETLEGVRVANTEDWTDDIARRAYYAAINKDVDTTIVTKGVGDVPLFAQTTIGRAAIQFKSFALASNQRVLMRGLQESPARFVGGMVGMTTIGMFIYMLKQIEAGREVSNNPGNWVAEGLDRSGIFSIGFEINNMMEKLGVPGVYAGAAGAARAINPSFDKREPASRFAVRGTAESLAGPSFGLINDVASIFSIAAKSGTDAVGITEDEGKLSPSDVSAMRRLLPFASLPYWRWAIDNFGMPALKEQVEP